MPQVTFGPFSLLAPPDWTLRTVILTGPPDGEQAGGDRLPARAVQPFQRNLVVTMEVVAATETAEAYRKRQAKGLTDAEVFWQQVGQAERVQLKEGALSGLLTEQIVLAPGGERVRQLQLICIKEGLAYTIVASHLDGDPFEGVRNEYRGMLLSFS